MKLSAIVLTLNEVHNIADCLTALAWAEELLVIDSGSTDGTVEMAQKHGARVVQHPFTDFASQRNFALQQATGDWVLFIDADERVTPALAEEIRSITQISFCVPAAAAGRCAYAIPRANYFFGHRLRFGDAQGDAPVRLFPRDDVSWTQPVHEKVVTTLTVLKLKHAMLHCSTRDLAHYTEKLREYLPLELETMARKGVKVGVGNLLFRPPAKFFYLYFFKGGILDGLAGLQYAILSSYYTAVKYWRYLKFGNRPQ